MTDKITYGSKPSYYDKDYRPIIKIDNKQITDLFNTVGSMDINEVKQQVLKEQIPYNIVDNNNNTLIHRVLLENDLTKTENQRLQMIKFLYSENVNPDGPNNNNLTPLHIACNKQYLNIIKYLIEIGVDINYQDNFGNTPLHRLFTGNIKPEEKTTIGNLIPKPKKMDTININLWRIERQKLWDSIKDSPFIQAINNTLKNSIGGEEEEINVVRDFQEQLVQLNLDLTKKDDIKLLKDIQAGSVHKFKTIIEKKWSKFSNIQDILIHPVEPDSYPSDDPSKLAVIKNSNSKKHITELLSKSLSNMKKLLIDVNVPDFINDSNIHLSLLQNYINENRNDLTQVHLEDAENNDKYIEEINKYRISYDFADNIINLNNNTFIGGARVCNIINNVNPTDYFDLFVNKNEDLIIPTLVYTIFTDFTNANNFNGNYNLIFANPQQTQFYNLLAEFIVDLINDKLNSNIPQITNFINNSYRFHRSLIPLMETVNEAENKASWLYCFINNFLCNNRFEQIGHAEQNLIFDINLSVIYLIAGLINNKNNLILSISQCMRKSLYRSIYNDNPADLKFGFLNNIPNNLIPGSTLCSLIYLIFTTDNINLLNNINDRTITEDNLFTFIDTITNDDINLNFIMKYSYNVFNNINNILDIPNDLKPIFELSSDKRENICNMISYYYNNMEQPPQSQMVADLIGLLRNTRDNQDDEPEIGIKGRLKRFIIPTVDDRNNLPVNQIYSVIEPNLPTLSGTMRNSKLFKIIGENESINAFILWTALEYALPSRVNLFLFRPVTTFTGDEEDRMYIMKFIESYYLGLNFIGHCPVNNIIPNIDLTGLRPPGPVIQTRYNLYNFDNYVDPGTNLPDDNINRPSFQTLGNSSFNRPTNIISFASVIISLYVRINRLVKLLTDRLNFMFNNMLKENSSSIYASVISYCYPLLVILSNYSKIIKEISNIAKNSRFKEGFEHINNVSEVNILGILNEFQEFKISKFESNINEINGYIYLLYYLNADTYRMKIPKFIYHALGTNKPLIIFDDNEKIKLKNINSNYDYPYVENNFDNRIGSINRDIGLFSNVINNIGYISKETLRESYIASKNKKLPPSLKSVLYEFYRYNIIEIIKNNNTIINDEIISAEVNDKNKNIQLIYLRAKIIEELVQLYFKNKINEYGKDIYNQLIRNKVPQTNETQQLFDKVDFSIVLNRLPDNDFINNVDVMTQSGLGLFYSFVEPKKIKKQFYIYPDNYFGTNLLKNKYTINIDLNIIKLMIENNANILIHNYEKVSPLVMMIKNNYYKALNLITFDNYDKNNVYSPQYYLMEKYKNHLDLYGKQLFESQYNEMVTIIQSNESYNNNLLKYMDVSFKVVFYIMEQYLTENMLRFSDDFDSSVLIQILNYCGFNRTNINELGKCKYNDLLGSDIKIPNLDEGITILNLIDELETKINKTTDILNKYNKEKDELINLGLNYNHVDNKITDTQNNITNLREQINKLNGLNALHNYNQIPQNITETKIVARYDELLREIGNTHICYMDGWRQLCDINNTIDRIPSNCIKFQKKKMLDMNSNIFKPQLEVIHKFYKHNYNIIRQYFENPRYINSGNKVLGFVYDLLVHLTKSFICSNIESIIKKILYEYIINIQNMNRIEVILEQIELMVSEIRNPLYNVIPKKFVRNSVNIYISMDDEASNPVETVAEILNNLVDLLKSSSYIEINDYTINILKNNIVQYFDTITFKLINNWNVVIENILLYHINHYRIIECMKNIN